MDDATKIAVIKLARVIGSIQGRLAGYRDIDERFDMERLKRNEQFDRGPEHAINNVRALTWDIHLADESAKLLPQNKLIRAVRRQLVIAHKAIGQADVPAELYLHVGDSEGAIGCCKNGFRRANKECGRSLKNLSAALLVAADTPRKSKTEIKSLVVRDPTIEARDKWIYSEVCKLVTYSTIIRKLANKPKSWPRIEQPNGIKKAASKYADRHGLLPIPVRSRGRLVKR